MDTFDAIYQRRAVKHYDPEHELTDDEIRKLMEAAVQSPTSFNIQNWRFVLVRDKELRRKIRAAANDQAQVSDASLLIVMTADLKSWEKSPNRYWRDAPKQVAEMTIKALNHVGKVIRGCRVLILGLTYKENVADTRETPVKGIIKELQDYGVDVWGCDPLLENAEKEFGLRMISSFDQAPKADAVIITATHDVFKKISLEDLEDAMTLHPVLIDVRGLFGREAAEEKGFCYRGL